MTPCNTFLAILCPSLDLLKSPSAPALEVLDQFQVTPRRGKLPPSLHMPRASAKVKWVAREIWTLKKDIKLVMCWGKGWQDGKGRSWILMILDGFWSKSMARLCINGPGTVLPYRQVCQSLCIFAMIHHPWRIHVIMLYMVTWIPSIYPSHVSILTVY